MNGLNTAYFFVVEKILSFQSFFMDKAWDISRGVLLISLCLAALNYALTGEGLKGNLIKIGKAFVFFVLIMNLYPRIVEKITRWTFDAAKDSAYASLEEFIGNTKTAIATEAENTAAARAKGTYGATVAASTAVSANKDPRQYFGSLIVNITQGGRTYTSVAPAAVLRVVLLIAGECLRFSDEAPKRGLLPNFGQAAKGMVCAFFIIFVGVLAVIEYLLAFLEFLLVTSVGIILFPLSLWEGSKFLAEKLIGAIIGFFIKLLFCNICIFLMLYGFLSLAKQFTAVPFTGLADEIVTIVFTCLLFYYICKSGPGLAQSLLSGTPSLSAAGAIGAATGAIAAAGGAMGMAKSAGGSLASGAVKGAFGAHGAITQAASAAKAVGTLDGSKGDKAGAFMSSLGNSAKETALGAGGDMVRSLMAGGSGGGGSGGVTGAGAGINKHSQLQKFLGQKNEDGSKQTFKQQTAARKYAGETAGIDYMKNKEAKAAKK
ncbi:MAG: type IV secretion system protein [Spirochaetaceae bacterium]|jgi:hypothetical protein|nr:type IV secretion system protein [Spirochaetaceae bacterium]